MCSKLDEPVNDIKSWLYIGHLKKEEKSELLKEFNMFMLEKFSYELDFGTCFNFSSIGYSHDYLETSQWDRFVSEKVDVSMKNKAYDIWSNFLKATNDTSKTVFGLETYFTANTKRFKHQTDRSHMEKILKLNINNLLKRAVSDKSILVEIFECIYLHMYKTYNHHFEVDVGSILMLSRRFKFPICMINISDFIFNRQHLPRPKHVDIKKCNTYICHKNATAEQRLDINQVMILDQLNLNDYYVVCEMKIMQLRELVKKFGMKQSDGDTMPVTRIDYGNFIFTTSAYDFLKNYVVFYHYEKNCFHIHVDYIMFMSI